MHKNRLQWSEELEACLDAGRLRNLQVIGLALTLGVVMFYGIITVVYLAPGERTGMAGNTLPLMGGLVLAVALGHLVAVAKMWQWMERRQLRKYFEEWLASRDAQARQKFHDQLQAMLIGRWALLDGPALFGAVGLFLHVHRPDLGLWLWAFLLPGAALFADVVRWFPTRSNLVQRLADRWEGQ